MDHRASVAAVRALVAGPEAFVAVLERAPDYAEGAFEAFLTHHRLLDWVAPALVSERAEQLVSASLREKLAAYRALRVDRNARLLRASVEIRSILADAGLACLFLKGLHVGQRFYGDVNRRHQGDIDALVHSSDFEAALETLGRFGFDVETNLDDGKPVAQRLREIRGRSPRKAPHAVAVSRGDTQLDLHWCLSSRSTGRVAEESLWTARQRFQVSGYGFETLSDLDTLEFLLVSLCEDLRRGACRAKHFLDLYLMLRALDPHVDWEAFCERQRERGVLKASINVLAVFLAVWDCAAEFPGIVRSLGRRLRLVELRGAEDALALMERPRGSAESRVWFRRVYPRSSSRYWAWRLTRDLPYTVSSLNPSRAFVLPDGNPSSRQGPGHR